MPLQSQAKDEDIFTTKDLRIALLLDQLSNAFMLRDQEVATGMDPKDAQQEAKNRTVTTINSLKALTEPIRLIGLLDTELARLQDNGLAPGHPTVQRLSRMIEALKTHEE